MEVSKISNQKNKQKIIDIIDNLWRKNYSFSISNMESVLYTFKNISVSRVIVDKIEDIALSICKSRVDASKAIERQSPTAEEEYESGRTLIKKGDYQLGFEYIGKAFMESDTLMKGEPLAELDEEKPEEDTKLFYYVLGVLLVFVIIAVFVILLKKKRD